MSAVAELYEAGVRDGDLFVPLSTGKPWDLLAPDPHAICWRDVAIRLARQPRFNGAARWSIAEHSLLVARLAPVGAKPWGLLHDAHEFALGDWITPVKSAVRELGGGDALAILERLSAAAIHQAAGLAFPPPPSVAQAVRDADLMALSIERRDVLDPGCADGWGENLPAPALRERLKPAFGAFERTAEQFLAALVELTHVSPADAR